MTQEFGTGPARGGILGRFENVQEKQSAKRIVDCDAATPEYLRNDFLKPHHLPVHRVDHELNYHATSNLNATKFHKGFQRRHQSDIQQDAPRLEQEHIRSLRRESLAQASVQMTMDHRQKHSFNVITGEGAGREEDFRQVGKKILNPFGCMEAVFAEHGRDAKFRSRNSKHRFFDHTVEPNYDRSANIFNEGLRETVRESAVIGYGALGNKRTRSQSCGVPDNYAHLKALPAEPKWEKPHNRNHSQIAFG